MNLITAKRALPENQSLLSLLPFSHVKNNEDLFSKVKKTNARYIQIL